MRLAQTTPSATKAMAGLSQAEAHHRLRQYGKNEISRRQKANPWLILLHQFTSPLILILIVAAILSLLMGYLPGQEPHVADSILIMAIVLLSGLFGFFQDYRAEKTIEALQEMTTPLAHVMRDGMEKAVPANEIVPGDLLLVEAGDIVAADGEILEGFQLEVDESILTGESIAVNKQPDEQVFMNTHVTSGHAKVWVKETGMQTRIGQIAGGLQDIEQEKTSFQRELAGLSKKLFLLTIGITLVVFVVGYFKYGLYPSLMTAISLAVAAIPEGLPAVVVLGLAIGARLMVKKNALIRRLSVAESIGGINLVCTDKTGTLTQNEMTVTRLYYDGREEEVAQLAAEKENPTLEQLLRCGWYCHNVKQIQQAEKVRFIGEQTELAIVKLSHAHFQAKHKAKGEKMNEVPFNSERKMMSVVIKEKAGIHVFAKGAPEVLIKKCNRILINGEVKPLHLDQKVTILEQNTAFASAALRVMGFAFKPTEDAFQAVEKDLIWIGLQAMIDPPRPEVREAIEDCNTAGIRVIMITGDNPVTADAIAAQIGLNHQGEVITGPMLEEISDEELKAKVASGTNIFARTTPFHKLRILEVLEEDYDIAMTGDGVNDALAVKRASVGIAMGLKGTEVTKQVSDIILMDDNFSTIRDAIRQGRTIFQNIRKFIDYLLTCNIAEVLVIFFATLFFELDGPVLFAVQILWINLLTDGLVALALGADPPANDTMLHPPRKLDEPLINRHLAGLIGLVGVKLMVLLLAVFWITLPLGLDIARTVLLTGFVLFEFVRIGAIRAGEKLGWLDNKWLIAALFTSFGMHLVILYTPLNTFFKLVPLGWYEWGILAAGVAIGYVLAVLIGRGLRLAKV